MGNVASLYANLAIYFVGLIFAAGGAWFRFSRLAKDVNGVGRKVNAMEKDDRYARIQMAIVAIAPEEKKQMVLECLGGKQP